MARTRCLRRMRPSSRNGRPGLSRSRIAASCPTSRVQPVPEDEKPGSSPLPPGSRPERCRQSLPVQRPVIPVSMRVECSVRNRRPGYPSTAGPAVRNDARDWAEPRRPPSRMTNRWPPIRSGPNWSSPAHPTGASRNRPWADARMQAGRGVVHWPRSRRPSTPEGEAQLPCCGNPAHPESPSSITITIPTSRGLLMAVPPTRSLSATRIGEARAPLGPVPSDIASACRSLTSDRFGPSRPSGPDRTAGFKKHFLIAAPDTM